MHITIHIWVYNCFYIPQKRLTDLKAENQKPEIKIEYSINKFFRNLILLLIIIQISKVWNLRLSFTNLFNSETVVIQISFVTLVLVSYTSYNNFSFGI